VAITKPLEINELKMVYQEIIEGCSRSRHEFFIKHLCEIEQIEVIRKRLEFLQYYISQGIPTEAERLTQLKAIDDWSDEKDLDILSYRQTISDNEKMIITVIPQQQAAIQQMIADNRKSLFQLLFEKRSLIGMTAEELSEKDGTYFLSFLSLFKDRECSKPIFESWEEFESLEEDKMSHYILAIDEVLERLQETNIRKISALPFFLNAFSYCKEDIPSFLNKPIARLTNYQIHLFSLGARNINILSQANGSPPEYFDNVPAEEVIKWYDMQYSLLVGKQKQARQG